MESIENKIYKRIIGKGGLWAFSDKDFWDIGSRGASRIALVRLVDKGKIRRIMRGLYDYPKFSDFLKQQLSPDLNQAAQALARKFSWRIQPSGNTALNLLGLSSQVPAKLIYFSDGPDREYKVGKRSLIFKKTALKHAGFKYSESGLIVQALESLTQDRFSMQIAQKIRSQFDNALLKRILLDTHSVKGWIYDCIREICLGEDHG